MPQLIADRAVLRMTSELGQVMAAARAVARARPRATFPGALRSISIVAIRTIAAAHALP